MAVIAAISAGFVYWQVYAAPASRLDAAWAVYFPFFVGIAAAISFLILGFFLPPRFYKFLRWLSRGTLGVFLYHYLLYPYWVSIIGPNPAISYFVFMFLVFFAMLFFFSFFQKKIDILASKIMLIFNGGKFKID
jgi:hypothetical protein